MERWGFYVSGILYGVLDKEDGRIFHQPLNVHTGMLEERRPLKEDDAWYRDLGKTDMPGALLRLEEYETGVQEAKRKGTGGFTTASGGRYEYRDENSYAQREKKYPQDLIVEDGRVIAFVTPARDQCCILVREGFEDKTVLARWKEMYRGTQEGEIATADGGAALDGGALPHGSAAPLYGVEPVKTTMVPMRDGVRLATDVYLPKPLDSRESAGRVPAVLVRTPYGKGRGFSSYYRFVQRGYAMVIQDVRGREDSEGEWLPSYCETEDGDDTLNWIAAQEWSDGNVGMTGGSYLGYVQWAAAASENPHLEAMLSSVCAGSAFVDTPRRGGCLSSGIMAWAFSVSGPRMTPERMVRDDWDEVLDIRPLEDLAPKALGYDVPFVRQWISHTDYDEMWARGNWKERTKGHRVPAFIMSGWFDDNGMGTTEALDLYHDYTEKKVVLGPWMHAGNADYDIHGFALGNHALRYDIDLMSFAWLDHYLKGVDNGIDRTPTVEYYTTGSDEWKTAENWPVPETEEFTLYLDGDRADAAVANEGRLSVKKADEEQTDHYLYDPKNPAIHIIDMSENEIEVPENYTEEEKRADVLCYSTDVLEEDLTITGDAQAVIYLSSDCVDTDLVVRITDVEPGGRSMKLADGLMDVKYRNRVDKPEYMEPGIVYPVSIRTTKLSHTFLKGHRLRVTVTSSAKNFTFPNRNTRDGFNSVECKVADNCVHRGGVHASKIVLRKETR